MVPARLVHGVLFLANGRLRIRAFALRIERRFSARNVGSNSVVGTFVPGSTLIVAISALATSAEENPWMLLAAAISLTIVAVHYPQFISRSEIFISRYGVASVFVARFAAVMRAFVPLISGILQMSPRHFCTANILSALAWAPAHVFPGVMLAMALRFTGASAEQRVVLLIAVLLAATLVFFHAFTLQGQVILLASRRRCVRAGAAFDAVFGIHPTATAFTIGKRTAIRTRLTRAAPIELAARERRGATCAAPVAQRGTR